MILNRDSIKQGVVDELIRESVALGLTTPFTDAERNASLQAALGGATPGEDVWLFGYGSLMWNPAFHFAERRAGRVHGFLRRYCMWSAGGRGTPQQPGLTLALDRGGSCHGIAFRIEADKAREELEVVWAREMVGGSYRARWVTLQSGHSSDGPVRALTFVVNRDHPRYAGDIPRDVATAYLATAAGPLGSCAEYLTNTVSHLDELGIVDTQMHGLLDGVRSFRGAPPHGCWEEGAWRIMEKS